MRPELTPLLLGALAFIAASSATPMFERWNRPELFRGKGGELLFGVMNLLILGGSISLLVWSFMHVTWYVAAGLIIAGVVVGRVAIRALPLVFMSALGPLLAAS